MFSLQCHLFFKFGNCYPKFRQVVFDKLGMQIGLTSIWLSLIRYGFEKGAVNAEYNILCFWVS